MQFSSWEYAGLSFEGLTLAGVRTSISLPQHSLSFDVAQGLPHAIRMNHFLITHGHMDHAAGIPYIIAQKNMSSHKTPKFIMPLEMVDSIREIMRQWSLIEGHEYRFELVGTSPGAEFDLSPRTFIRTFPTIHRVPSLGYSLCRRYRKLRKELIDKPQEEISRLRKEGRELTEERTQLLVSFTGDTEIEFLDRNPEVLSSKILMMEVTYFDERKSVASTKEWGHTHLDELLPRLSDIKSDRIVLIHSSARYSLNEIESILDKRIPPHERNRIVLFPAR